MKPKFKVGDKVKVIPKNNITKDFYTTTMSKQIGKVFTIKRVHMNFYTSDNIFDGDIYELEGNDFLWRTNLLELVKDNNMERTLSISLNKAKELYKNSSEEMKELLLSTFTKEELTKKELPNTWEEFCENYPRKVGEYWISELSYITDITPDIIGDRAPDDDRNLLPNKKTAKAVLALCQLIQLRDCYNGDWKPDWSNYQEVKYSISIDGHNIVASGRFTGQRILSFKTPELRDKFLSNFKDIIKQAKELI